MLLLDFLFSAESSELVVNIFSSIGKISSEDQSPYCLYIVIAMSDILSDQITHSGEGKTMTFIPHQAVIKDFKNPQNILATETIDDITRLYKLTTLGHHLFFQFLLLIMIT